MKIVLLGYMGCGKSVVGDFLAKKLQIKHYDLDIEIEKISKKSIKELFESKGEIYFRKLEHQIFKSILAKNESYVLSLGGGTPCYYNNHELLQQDAIFSFYLKSSVANLVKRVANETSKRPILSNFNATELTEFINKHLFERSFFYHQVSHIITIDDQSVAEISDKILQKLA